jgi:hypothetical protein
MPHVPPPPQAEGRNIWFPERVLRIVDPGDTVISLSLMVRVTSPWGVSFFLHRGAELPAEVLQREIQPCLLIQSLLSIVLISYQKFFPLKFNTHKAHECNTHKAGDDKGNTESPQRSRHIAVSDLFTYSRYTCNSQ